MTSSPMAPAGVSLGSCAAFRGPQHVIALPPTRSSSPNVCAATAIHADASTQASRAAAEEFGSSLCPALPSACANDSPNTSNNDMMNAEGTTEDMEHKLLNAVSKRGENRRRPLYTPGLLGLLGVQFRVHGPRRVGARWGCVLCWLGEGGRNGASP